MQVIEINRVEELGEYARAWDSLLEQTPGASFFQSRQWLAAYWKHYGATQRLRALIVVENDRPTGILPLTVLTEKTKVGRLRFLTYPLHNWGSFYGPTGQYPPAVLRAGLEYVRQTPRDWDVLELRWHGGVSGETYDAGAAMTAAGFPPYRTVWDRTSIVDIVGTWDDYCSTRKSAWLRRFHAAERKLRELGKLEYIRWRPAGARLGDGLPRWDLYDACERLAAKTWQAEAKNGTTLSDDPVRGFLREVHEAAAAGGAVDVNLLTVGGEPAAFIYGYHWRGCGYGLRRGYDPRVAREGAGNVLLEYTLRDSFARGDSVYDMGIGSLESKRHFQSRLAPIFRYSHIPPGAVRAQPLRLKRWWQSQRTPSFTAVGRVQDFAADSR